VQLSPVNILRSEYSPHFGITQAKAEELVAAGCLRYALPSARVMCVFIDN
jgi:hypothetical protein